MEGERGRGETSTQRKNILSYIVLIAFLDKYILTLEYHLSEFLQTIRTAS